MDERAELIQYLETLKNGFDANNPMHLKGLLYLVYCDSALPKDERFSQEMLNLIEQISNNNPNQECNLPNGECNASPCQSPICPWMNVPSTIEFAFLSSGARALFGDYSYFYNEE